MRKFVIAANWKMHKSPSETTAYFNAFLPKLDDSGAAKDPAFRKVIFFVPAIDLITASQSLRGTNVGWGAQNCHFEMKGAFTGENSPQVLAELATPFALVGHSERRAIFHETEAETAKKVKALHQVGMTPMLCVGESLAEREAGQTNNVIIRQLTTGLSERDSTKPIIVAYEPVWAIGTGEVATAEDAQEVCQALRTTLAARAGGETADGTRILYGGSVKADNVVAIMAQPDVDGALVGGASLDADEFAKIVRFPASHSG